MLVRIVMVLLLLNVIPAAAAELRFDHPNMHSFPEAGVQTAVRPSGRGLLAGVFQSVFAKDADPTPRKPAFSLNRMQHVRRAGTLVLAHCPPCPGCESGRHLCVTDLSDWP